VGPRADFLRVARTDRHGKSSKGLRGTPNRRGLLRSLMAKVEHSEVPRIPLPRTPVNKGKKKGWSSVGALSLSKALRLLTRYLKFRGSGPSGALGSGA
jgi:hypothetical protein